MPPLLLCIQITSVLADMYPEHAAVAKSPKQVWITRWGSDPYALGSYACMAKGSTPADIAALAAPVGNTLYFAGEAMSDRNQGTVHGAYGTGLDAAVAVLEQLARRGHQAAVWQAGHAADAARLQHQPCGEPVAQTLSSADAAASATDITSQQVLVTAAAEAAAVAIVVQAEA